ncbi:MAG: DUF5811 family protein [Halorhabdus sp.]
MYGNAPFQGQSSTDIDISPDQRRALRSDLTRVAARTRELLPADFVVGSELTTGNGGLQATIAVQPPVGAPVSAGYTPDSSSELRIDEGEQTELAHGLAASAALQMKQAMQDTDAPAAQ